MFRITFLFKRKLCVAQSYTRFLGLTPSNSSRFRQKSKKITNPGISERASLFADDSEFLKNLEHEEDFGDLEAESLNAEKQFSDRKRNLMLNDKIARQKMTIRKFFRPPKQPKMLTWNEHLQIQYLHEQDPETWTVDKLSDSFPASKEVISKILNQRWKPNTIEIMKRKDLQVAKNWELLEKDMLDADPSLIEHYKKFSSRKDTLLAQINSEEFYQKMLEVKKEEPNWNNGQMKSILISYEKSLEELERKHLQLERNTMKEITDETGPSTAELTHVTHEETMKQRIEFDKVFQHHNDKEKSFVLGGGSVNGNEVTLSELQQSIAERYNSKETLSLPEKVILNNALNENVKMNFKKTTLQDDEIKQPPHITSTLMSMAGYKNNIEVEKEKPTRRTDTLARTLRFQMSSSADPIKEMNLAGNKNNIESEKEKPTMPTDTLARTLRFQRSSSADPLKEMKKLLRSAKPTPVQEVIEAKEYQYDSTKDEHICKQEEESLQGTCFWNRSSILPTVASNKNISVESVKSSLNFPKKIKVPKGKHGSGLTFKVKDCYYDDDGEFLYRVPGMSN